MNEKRVYARQLDIIKPSELNFPILIIGAGGIGSWATLALAKMGCSNITVVDFDKVEEKNMPSQLYTLAQKGEYKVDALQAIVNQLTDINIIPVKTKYQDWTGELQQKSYTIIVFAVDSLEQRREIWQKLVLQGAKFDMLLDARMAKELIRVLVASPYAPQSIIEYAKTLDANKPPHQEPCTERAVVYNTFMCGGLIASLVKKFVKRETVKKNIIFDITNLAIL